MLISVVKLLRALKVNYQWGNSFTSLLLKQQGHLLHEILIIFPLVHISLDISRIRNVNLGLHSYSLEIPILNKCTLLAI